MGKANHRVGRFLGWNCAGLGTNMDRIADICVFGRCCVDDDKFSAPLFDAVCIQEGLHFPLHEGVDECTVLTLDVFDRNAAGG